MQVKPNTLWKHKNGNKYKVLLLANQKSERLDEYPVMVIYQNVDTHSVWARRLDDWHRSMSFHGYDYEYNMIVHLNPEDPNL
jgi:hypothetical protein